jgi:hypothetical protein
MNNFSMLMLGLLALALVVVIILFLLYALNSYILADEAVLGAADGGRFSTDVDEGRDPWAVIETADPDNPPTDEDPS